MNVVRFRAAIWLALMLRDIGTRGGDTRLRYAIVILEPFGQLAMMYGVFAFLNRKPDFGSSLFLFLATGVIPYFLFTHVASRVSGVVRGGTRMRAGASVTSFDQAFARFLIESLTVVVMTTAVLGAAAIVGVPDAEPAHPLLLVAAFSTTALLALGVGMTNAILTTMFGAYAMIWSIAARSLIFFSGVFYTVDYLSPTLRSVLWFNPVMHGSILFRAGVYADYPVLTLSVSYLAAWTLGALLIGLILTSRATFPRGHP